MRLVPLALVLLAVLAFQDHATAEPPTRQVEVVNFPDPQNVTGAVAVTNFPDPQSVTGTVEVTNDAATAVPVEVVNLPPVPGAQPRMQLVGFTIAALPANTGVLGFTVACQDEYPGSRMCNSVEVMETITVPRGFTVAAGAWVRPVYQPGGFAFMDASGRGNSGASLACSGWSSTGTVDLGLSVTPSGRFQADSCGATQGVACCAPVP
jgi:hypothetical protein